MQFILVISAALIPGLFWMWWYYRQDVFNKEPKALLAKVFVLSMPLSLLIGLFEFVVDQSIIIEGKPLSQSNNILLVILFYLIVVGLTEELG
jgi:RsiW-degrading membrane proteinase PrsW (M82 family)